MEEMFEGGELRKSDSFDKNYDAAYEEAAREGEEALKKEMARRDGNLWKKVKNVILQFIEKTSVFIRVTANGRSKNSFKNEKSHRN